MSSHRRMRAPRRPWVLALVVILLVTGLSLALQSRLPFVGTDSAAQLAGSAEAPTGGEPAGIVSSTEFERIQQVVPAPPPFRRAPKEQQSAKLKCVTQSDVTLNVVTFNIHSGLGPNGGLDLEQLSLIHI